MKGTRAIPALSLVGVCLLLATSAAAQQTYSLTGKLISARGGAIKIPLVGSALGNCNAVKWGRRQTLTKAPPVTPLPIPTQTAAPYGCMAGAGTVTATDTGTGAAFTLPTGIFSRPLPGMTLALSVPGTQQFVQLATNFSISGPPASIPNSGVNAPGGTMRTPLTSPTNVAPFRRFQRSAWRGGPKSTSNGQTGRASANFTWCAGSYACTRVSQGTGSNARLLVKYTGGPNRFGGTMSYVVGAPPGNGSNLAMRQAFPKPSPPFYTLGAALLRLSGPPRQQPTGRGYADYLTNRVRTGPVWQMAMTNTVYVPAIMQSQMLITMVTNLLDPGPGTLTAFTLGNYGFPWTTGTVIVRVTGNTALFGNPATLTLSGMGKDSVSPNGARNLTLVAGQLARSPVSNTPGLGFLALPEPGRGAQLLAGALVLVGVAAWRTRRGPSHEAADRRFSARAVPSAMRTRSGSS